MGLRSSRQDALHGTPRSPSVGNGQTLAVVSDPRGIQIAVSLVAWEHIQSRHPEISSLDELRVALESPQIITRSSHSESGLLYYRLTGKRWNRANDLYMTVVVEQRGESRGSVKTAYLSRKLKTGGETLWMKR